MTDWSTQKFSKLPKKIKKAREEVTNAAEDHVDSSKLREAQNRLDHLLQMEEEYWRVRARTNWIKNGDKNTTYFHHHASQRRKKNMLSELADEHGAIMTTQLGLEQVTVNYFEALFKVSQTKIDFDTVFQMADFPQLSPTQFEALS